MKGEVLREMHSLHNSVPPVKIANLLIGAEHPPFIVAEMSGNHMQSLERAMCLVEAAAQAGADALKLQTYTADTMTLDVVDGDFLIQTSASLWQGESLYSLYQKAHTPWAWHQPIMERCKALGLLCFSSPFDHSAVDFLASLNVPAYKIASFEIVDIPLILKVAQTGKPLIISTGMASEEEVSEAVHAAKSTGNQQIILLKCTSSYPASPKDSNLSAIPYMHDRFGLPVGLSDHTSGYLVPVTAVGLGAVVIEKHLTLSRADGSVDSAFSLEPKEFKDMVNAVKVAHQSLGKAVLGSSQSEKKSLQFRRSLYVAEDILAGEVFTEKNIRSIRPGYGLSPKYMPRLLGQQSLKNAKKGTPLTWDCVEPITC